MGHERPAFMVPPAAIDLEVAGRKAFLPEATSPHQRNGRCVAGLDVRLQPVQLQWPKGVAQQLLHARTHQALALVTGEDVVAQVGVISLSVQKARLRSKG